MQITWHHTKTSTTKAVNYEIQVDKYDTSIAYYTFTIDSFGAYTVKIEANQYAVFGSPFAIWVNRDQDEIEEELQKQREIEEK